MDQPEEAFTQSTMMDRAGSRFSPARRALAALCILTGLLVSLVAWGVLNARAQPLIRLQALRLADWPVGDRPVRVALLADIHLGNVVMDEARLKAVVAQVNAARPDLVMIAGDFLVGHDAVGAGDRAAKLTGPLLGLEAPLGTVAVLGNHDNWTSANAVRSALMAARITVLENEAVQRGPLAIAGIGDAFSGHHRADQALVAARRLRGSLVVLTHSPDLAPKLPADVPLVLAGHTHCGQIVLPWIGALPARSPLQGWKRLYNPRYRCGLVRDGRRVVIVTAGVGSGTLPLRFGAPPDFWLVTLD
ncbi:MAG TPA: metallophosphoesterase [Caulobacteraceae bacterium]